MADALGDGNIRIYSVPTIANIASPTTTELNAGTDLTPSITPDGLAGFNPDTAAVDNSRINSTYNTSAPGRSSFSGTLLRFVKVAYPGTDTIFNTLVRGYATNIVVRRSGIAYGTAFASGQPLQVFPVTCGEVSYLPPEANSVDKYEVPVLPSATPNQRAAVA